jgi:peptidoglycan/xylan/chitin deacetylase (PgdA/CDA1 family)
MLIPYPFVTVDMGCYLSRSKEPGDLERLWIDYVIELSREAEADATRGATVVAIGIHPFVVGTPPGAAALRRVLQNFKQQKLVWATNVDRVLSTRNAERLFEKVMCCKNITSKTD